ncbi:MAG: hypothetical protein JW844_04720 [Candidatus Omnitrophica bacterium]|nr:hypothetical protein [Candidatus Omnitrophota bacterium]
MAKLNEDDMLEGIADILSKMKPTQRKKLETLMNAKARGIKKTRKVKKLSLGSGDLILSEEEEEVKFGKDGGIVHNHVTSSGLYDCGHARTHDNFGHQAECGHTACKACVEKEHLVCAKKGCMQKLCPRDDCYRFVVNNMNLCKKHAREINVNAWLAIFNLHDRNIICKPGDR